MHSIYDDNNNIVLEDKRIRIDLSARKFGSDLALAEMLLRDKLSAQMRKKIDAQAQSSMTDLYSRFKELGKLVNSRIHAIGNRNAVYTTGTIFSIIDTSKNQDEHIAALGSTLNSIKYYLSGFDIDEYCFEGTIYRGYGFGHYLYLAQTISDYTSGKINLFTFDLNNLKNVGNFLKYNQVNPSYYAPFFDVSLTASHEKGNFAYMMAAKYHCTNQRSENVPDEGLSCLIERANPSSLKNNKKEVILPEHTYFDNFGIVISRGRKNNPLSTAIIAGHDAENHIHFNSESYSLFLGDKKITGDIGALSYTAGAFNDDNKARSLWGHTVPIIENTIPAKNREANGKITNATFTNDIDKLGMDTKAVYHIKSLKK